MPCAWEIIDLIIILWRVQFENGRMNPTLAQLTKKTGSKELNTLQDRNLLVVTQKQKYTSWLNDFYSMRLEDNATQYTMM